jgi:hypothetical protein
VNLYDRYIYGRIFCLGTAAGEFDRLFEGAKSIAGGGSVAAKPGSDCGRRPQEELRRRPPRSREQSLFQVHETRLFSNLMRNADRIRKNNGKMLIYMMVQRL